MWAIFFVKGQQWGECFLRSDNFMKRFLFSKLWNMKISLDKSSKFGDNGYFFHVLQCVFLSFFMIKSKKNLRDWKLWQKNPTIISFFNYFPQWRKLTFLKNIWFVVFFLIIFHSIQKNGLKKTLELTSAVWPYLPKCWHNQNGNPEEVFFKSLSNTFTLSVSYI